MKGDEARELAAFINAGLGRYRAAAFELSRDTWVILDDLEGPVNPPPIDDVGRYLGLFDGLRGVVPVAPELRDLLERFRRAGLAGPGGDEGDVAGAAGAAGADVRARKRA